jgi:hypothetical protein
VKALVYVNWGRLVIECEAPGCGDARGVEIGQKTETCVNGHVLDLEWPDNLPQILAALSERTSDKRKNWFPKNHPLAVATGQPHGQSVRELREEAVAGEEADAQTLADKRAFVLEQARALDIPAEQVLAALKGS